MLADIARRQDSILRQAADGDPDDPFTKGLRGSYNDLEAQKNATLAAVAELDRQLNLNESILRTKLMRPEVH